MGNKNTYGKTKLSAFFDYLEGKIKGRERNAFERTMERDPFEAEALEGFENVSREEAAEDMRLLSDKLRTRVAPVKRQRTPWYGIAAAVASIMVVSTLFILLNDGDMKKLETLPEMQEAGREAADAVSPAISNGPAQEDAQQNDLKKETGDEKAMPSPKLKDSGQGQEIPEDGKTATVERDYEIDEASGAVKSKKSISVSEPIQKEKIQIDLADEELAETELIRTDEVNSVKIFQEEGNAATVDQVKGETGELLTKSPAGADKAENSPRQMSAKSAIQVTGEGSITKMQKNIVYDNSTAVDVNEMQNIDSKKRKTMAHQRQMTVPASTKSVTDPIPIGGYEAFQVYLDSALVLPDAFDQTAIQNVQLQFNISPEGKPSNIQILRSPGKALSDKAVEVIEEGPLWKPALENGTYISSDILLEVTFRPVK